MPFVSIEDFYEQAGKLPRLTHEEEKHLALEKEHNAAARAELIAGYLPFVAGYIRRMPKSLQNLRTVYTCLVSLEKEVDSFNFLRDGETFAHHLNRRLRQCITYCMACETDLNIFR